MNKSYYNQEEVARGFTQFLQKTVPNIRKTSLNILPYILIGLIDGESVVTADISKRLNGKFNEVQDESVQKRIRRFFNNKLLDMYDIYDQIISSIIKDYSPSHEDKRVHISFDHMYSKDNYTIFMFTLRLGKQDIPVWFKAFEGNENPNAFQNSLMIEGIKYIINLFKDKDVKLVFLADRWFYNFKIINYIDKHKYFFAVRMKANTNTNIYIYDKKEKHIIRKYASDIKPYTYHSKFFKDVYFTRRKFKYNMTVSKSNGVKEAWYIVTNMEPNRAIKDYGYRFGSIETVFKNEKTN